MAEERSEAKFSGQSARDRFVSLGGERRARGVQAGVAER